MLRTCALTGLLLAALCAAATADEIKIKGGTTLHGKVGAKTAEGVMIQLDGGGVTVVEESEILVVYPSRPAAGASAGASVPAPPAPVAPPAAPAQAPGAPAGPSDAAKAARDAKAREAARIYMNRGDVLGGPSGGVTLERARGRTPGWSIELPAGWRVRLGAGVDEVTPGLRAAGAPEAALASLDLMAVGPEAHEGRLDALTVHIAPGINEEITPSDLASMVEGFPAAARQEAPGAAEVSVLSSDLRRIGAATAAHMETEARQPSGLVRTSQWIVPGERRSYVVRWSAARAEFPAFARVTDARMASFEGAVPPGPLDRLVAIGYRIDAILLYAGPLLGGLVVLWVVVRGRRARA